MRKSNHPRTFSAHHCLSMNRFFLYLMAALYILAGINHFWHPRTYLGIMPPYIPYPAAMVAVSGICEVLFGGMLLMQQTRVMGAWLIIALLIAVFPANIQMATNWQRAGHPLLWLAIARLPLQALLIWWAWAYTRA